VEKERFLVAHQEVFELHVKVRNVNGQPEQVWGNFAAKSRGTRNLAELSLNEADGYARTIKNEELRTTIEAEIEECRQELNKKIYKKQK